MEVDKVVEIDPNNMGDLLLESKNKVKYKVTFRWIGDGSVETLPINKYSDLKLNTVSIIHSIDRRLVGVVAIDKNGNPHPYEIPKKWNVERKVAEWII